MPNFLISPKDIYSALDDNGNPLSGGRLYTYVAGSSTPTPTFTDASGNVENANPVVLDARGEAPVWLNDEMVYKFVLRMPAPDNTTIRTTDNITANSGGGSVGISFVTHTDSTSVELNGLGTPASPLEATALISSITSNALGITTSGSGGMYVADLSEAIADKLDKVDPTAQSVVSEVTLKEGLILGDSKWIKPETPQSPIFITNGANPSGLNSTVQLYNDSLVLTSGDGTTQSGEIGMGGGQGILFNDFSGKYGFTNVPDETPTKSLGLNASNEVVQFEPASQVDIGQGLVRGGSGEIKLGPHYLSMASSGVYSGGLLSVSAPVDSNVTIGVTNGFVIDTSTFGIDTILTTAIEVTTPIVFTPTNIATQNVTYVGINSSGVQIEWNALPTPEQRRDNIFLGVAVHSNRTTVEFVNNLQDVSSDVTGQLHDLSRYLGYFNIEGNGVGANGVSLSFDKALGKAFKTGVNFEVNPKDPDTNYLPAKVLSDFRYRTQTGLEGANINVIDPTSYDLGGVVTSIGGSNNQTTIQRIYVFASNQIRVQYGQEIYSSFSDAVDAVGKESFVTESNIKENGLLLCSLVVKKGCTDLSVTSDARFFQAGRFGEIGSVGSTATGTLQTAYNNSINPEIETNATLGALTLKRGSALDSDNVLEVSNGVGSVTSSITGSGAGVFSGVDITGALAGGLNVKLPSTAYIGNGVNPGNGSRIEFDSYLNFRDSLGNQITSINATDWQYTANTGSHLFSDGSFNVAQFSRSATVFDSLNYVIQNVPSVQPLSFLYGEDVGGNMTKTAYVDPSSLTLQDVCSKGSTTTTGASFGGDITLNGNRAIVSTGYLVLESSNSLVQFRALTLHNWLVDGVSKLTLDDSKLVIKDRIIQGDVTNDGSTGILGTSAKFTGSLGSIVVGQSPDNTTNTGHSIKFTRDGANYINYKVGGGSGNLRIGGLSGDSAIQFLPNNDIEIYQKLYLKSIGTGTPIGNLAYDATGKLVQAVAGQSYTTTEKNALTATEGLQVYDSTLKKMSFYNGTAWETITSA